GEDVIGHNGVDGQRDECLTTLLVPNHLHTGDVDIVITQQRADAADDAGAVLVGQEHHVLGQADLHGVVVDLHQLLELARARQGPRHRHPGAVGQHTTYRDEVAPIAVVLTGDEVDLHATFLGGKRCVD